MKSPPPHLSPLPKGRGEQIGMKLYFTKMQGTGNDFILLNGLAGDWAPLQSDIIKRLCDRRFGIGADQLLVVAPSKKGDFRMDIYNADGNQVEMCGNGIRCLAKFVIDNKLTAKEEISVETLAGIVKPRIISDHPQNSKDALWVKVDMGEPVLEGERIPVKQRGQVINQRFELFADKVASHESRFFITCVSMGNPHCVIFVNDVDNYPVREYGPVIEMDPFFPKRVNTEFVELIDKKNIKMRVWERGSGETLACGTGACAAVVASVLNKKTGREVKVWLKGGDLEVAWDEKSNHVFMTGPAVTVYEGQMEI